MTPWSSARASSDSPARGARPSAGCPCSCSSATSPASGASGVAAGMLAPVTEADFGDERLLRANLESRALWAGFAAELEELTGLDTGYRESGALVVAADRDDAEELRRLHALHRRWASTPTWLVPSACRREEPGLSPRVAGGILAPGRRPGGSARDGRRARRGARAGRRRAGERRRGGGPRDERRPRERGAHRRRPGGHRAGGDRRGLLERRGPRDRRAAARGAARQGPAARAARAPGPAGAGRADRAHAALLPARPRATAAWCWAPRWRSRASTPR